MLKYTIFDMFLITGAFAAFVAGFLLYRSNLQIEASNQRLAKVQRVIRDSGEKLQFRILPPVGWGTAYRVSSSETLTLQLSAAKDGRIQRTNLTINPGTSLFRCGIASKGKLFIACDNQHQQIDVDFLSGSYHPISEAKTSSFPCAVVRDSDFAITICEP